MNLTIVVPTLNRSKKFENFLEYYSNNNYRGNILVIDSSTAKEKKNNIFFIKKYSSLKIKYIYLPKKKYRQNFLKCIRKIRTKYTVYSGDDDFFLLNSLKYLTAFLDKNNSYQGACGIGLTCFKDRDKYRTSLYKGLLELNEKNGIKRLKKQLSFNGYTVIHYSIIRTSIWKLLKDPKFYYSSDISGEYFYTFSLGYLARIKQFKKLIYLVRFLGNARYELQENKKKEVLYLIKILNKFFKRDNNLEYLNNKNLISNLIYKKIEMKKNYRNKLSIFKILNILNNIQYSRKFQNFLDVTKINKYYLPKFHLDSLTIKKKKYHGFKELRLLIEFYKKKKY
ncbi:TIGR00180 family glycosyltransferase [Candidatus Pelagibacter sp.]|nr:TIGR00180 family glycosyltransferase [Candidatus Pelagibacter sp.]